MLYADDMLLNRRISSPEDFILKDGVDAVNNWVHENHFCFSTTKCKFMLISHKTMRDQDPCNIMGVGNGGGGQGKIYI